MKMLSLSLILSVAASGAQAAPRGINAASEADARKVTTDFARCTVNEKAEATARALIEDWDSKAITGEGADLLSPGCVREAGLVRAIRFSAGSVRAALAEQMILANSDLTVASAAALAPLAYRQPWPVKMVDDKGRPLKASSIEGQQRAVSGRLAMIAGQQVAECVVRAKPVEARAVFVTKAGSPEEMTAIQALTPVLPSCVPAGKKLSFDRNSLRGSLAISYYRLAMASRGMIWAGETAPAGGAQK